MLFHKYIIVQYLYKKLNLTPHLFAHSSPHLCYFCCYIFFSLRLGPMKLSVLHEDCNVIFVVNIRYIEVVVSYLHDCLVFVQKPQCTSLIISTWLPTCQ